DEFGFWSYASAEILRVRRVGEDRLNAQLGEGVMEQVIGTTVEAGGRNNLVSSLGNVEDGEGFGGLPGGCRQCPNPALERRYPFLEHRPSGIHNAGVDVAEFLQGEKVSGVGCVLENIGTSLVNRDGARPGGGIG